MDTVTTAFLLIGGVGVVVLGISLFVGDVLHFGHPDAGGPFSVPAIAGFVGAFGFAGAIAASLASARTDVLLIATGAGLIAALPTAWLAIRLARWAINMRTDATPTHADMIGKIGVVVTRIPLAGYGEVRIPLGGQPVKLYARADRPIPQGARVFVIEAPSSTSVVVEQTTPIEEA